MMGLEARKILLERAERCIFSMEKGAAEIASADDIKFLEAEWADFIGNYTKAFKFIREATQSGPAKLWSDKFKIEQRMDSILNYLFHARNADGHGLEFVSVGQSATANLENIISMGSGKVIFENSLVTDVGPDGRKRVRVLSGVLNVRDGRLISPPPIGFAVVERRRFLKLLPVLDRGQTYYVPNIGLPEDALAEAMAQYASKWMRAKCHEAKGHFADNS